VLRSAHVGVSCPFLPPVCPPSQAGSCHCGSASFCNDSISTHFKLQCIGPPSPFPNRSWGPGSWLTAIRRRPGGPRAHGTPAATESIRPVARGSVADRIDRRRFIAKGAPEGGGAMSDVLAESQKWWARRRKEALGRPPNGPSPPIRQLGSDATGATAEAAASAQRPADLTTRQGPEQSRRKGVRNGWLQLITRFLQRGRSACTVLEAPYSDNVQACHAMVAEMARVDVTCQFCCVTLPPPHVRRKRWRGLPGQVALRLGQHALRRLVGGDPLTAAMPVVLRISRTRRWGRESRVIELTHRPAGRPGCWRNRGVCVRFEERP
jgi:hypothetical protein